MGTYRKLKTFLISNFNYCLDGFNKRKPAEVFLFVSVIFGLGFLVFTPPMQSPDEVEHFYRSYQVSELQFPPQRVTAQGHGGVGEGYGGELPKSVVETATILKGKTAGSANKFDYSALRSVASLPLDSPNKQKIRFDNTTIYSPIPYIPQALGIGFGKVFDLSPLLLSYLGRIFNLIFWITILYIAIRITPLGKWAFATIALNPVSIFLATNLSPDTFTSATIALLIAMILKLRQNAKNAKHLLPMIILTVLLVSLLKNSYLPIIFILFAIPSSILSVKFKTLISAFALIIGLLWNLIVLSAAESIPEYFGMQGNIDAHEQIAYILNEPLRSSVIFIWNLVGTPSVVLPSSYNSVIGWGDIPLPFWLSLLSFFGLFIAFLYRDSSKGIVRKVQPTKVRLLFISIFIASSTAIVMSLYTGWSEVGSRLIKGIQGRYYIPISFLLVPVLTHTNLQVTVKRYSIGSILLFIYLTTLSVSLLILFLRYSYGIWW